MKNILLATTAFALVSPAVAQDFATSDDVVVVTAQKREQNIKDVPIAITAFDQDALDDLGVQQFDDLADFVPGLEVQEQSANNPGFVIRGITSDNGEATTEPRVAIFKDGVPISRSRGSFVELFDTQVEVVRGPQPTLFGRSALIGAINMVSNKPEFDGVSGSAKAGIGDDEYRLIEGVVNLPLSDKAAFRLAARHKSRDGYVENLIGEDLNGYETSALRGSFRVRPTDAIDATIIASYQKDNNPGTSFKSGTFFPTDAAGNFGDIAPERPASLSSVGGLDGNAGLGLDREVYGVTGLVDIDLSDIYTLSATASWREFNSSEVFDPDGFALPLFGFAENADSTQYFGEIRLGFAKDRVTGFVGASIFDEDGQQNVPLYYDERVAQALLGGFLFTDTPGVPQAAPPLGALPTVNADPTSQLFGAPLGIYAEQFTNFGENRSYDVFGDVTFEVTDRFDVTAGIRYTKDEKKTGYAAGLPTPLTSTTPPVTRPTTPGDLSNLTGAGLFLGAAVFNNNVPIFVEDDYDGFTWRVAANYDLTDDVTVYANYGHGRRPEVLAYTLDEAEIGLDPNNFTEIDAEETDAYEAGLRGDFFGGRVNADVVAYWYEYTNFQTTVQDGSGAFIPANAGNASGPGFEGSAFVDVAPELNLFATYAFNGVEFDDEGDNGAPQERAGNRFRLAPEHGFTIGAEFTYECDCGTFTFQPVYAWKSEIFFDDDNDRPDLQAGDFFQDEVQDDYGLLDLQFGWSPASDETLDIKLIIENATDEEYLLDAGNTGDAFGIPTFIAGSPRFWHVSVSKSF